MIAYSISVHKAPEQVLHLLDAIYREEDIYVIHVDRKSAAQVEKAIRAGTAGKSNIQFLDRQACNWGGWSQVKIELDAIRHLVNRDARWSHYINLSGQDYPLVPVGFVAEFLNVHQQHSFLEILDPKVERQGDEYLFLVSRWDRYHWDSIRRVKNPP